MVKEVLDEALGLGPLEDLLADDLVTEIMVNARDQIYVEKAGKPMMSKTTFSSEAQMMNVIERIVTPLGRRVDEKVPYVDARLQDGSRVHIIIPPLALRGPTITIRKFPKKRIESKDLITYGSMTEEIADFLRSCVEAKLNIVVSGGTGSGENDSAQCSIQFYSRDGANYYGRRLCRASARSRARSAVRVASKKY